MDTTKRLIWLPSLLGFWKTGLALAALAAALIIGEGAQYFASLNAVSNVAALKVRSEHSDVAWAFQEWDDCQHGRGRYADGQKPVYFTQDQCNAAVDAQAQVRGDQHQVTTALKNQSIAVDTARSIVAPAWPLSLFF